MRAAARVYSQDGSVWPFVSQWEAGSLLFLCYSDAFAQAAWEGKTFTCNAEWGGPDGKKMGCTGTSLQDLEQGEGSDCG